MWLTVNPLEGVRPVRWERKLGIRRPWFKLGLEADLLCDLEIPLFSGSVSLKFSDTADIKLVCSGQKAEAEEVSGCALPARP